MALIIVIAATVIYLRSVTSKVTEDTESLKTSEERPPKDKQKEEKPTEPMLTTESAEPAVQRSDESLDIDKSSVQSTATQRSGFE